MVDAPVLLLEVLEARDATGTARTVLATDGLIPACDTASVDVITAPTSRGA